MCRWCGCPLVVGGEGQLGPGESARVKRQGDTEGAVRVRGRGGERAGKGEGEGKWMAEWKSGRMGAKMKEIESRSMYTLSTAEGKR